MCITSGNLRVNSVYHFWEFKGQQCVFLYTFSYYEPLDDFMLLNNLVQAVVFSLAYLWRG